MMPRDMELEDVRQFHQKFDQLDPSAIAHLTKRKLAERANFMLEELIEFAHDAGLVLKMPEEDGDLAFVASASDQDMVGQADALVDLCYVLKGTAAMMGLGAAWVDLWDDVQRANMEKVKGPTHRQMGYGADVCKPPGWSGPWTAGILAEHGYRRAAFCDDGGRVADAWCLDDEGAPR
jgi:predicted HAD superfamily Cof-like phosphohydrolase